MRKYLLVMAVLAVVLSACRIETNIIMNIEEDGSAEYGAEIGFDDEFLQFMEESGGSPDDLMTDLPQFGSGEGVATERVDGDMTYYGFVATVDDLSTFDPNVDGESFSSFNYTFDDKSATLTAELSATDLADMGDEFPMDPSTITDDLFSANLIVRMPGEVTEHDADEVRADGTLVWKVPLSGTQTVNATSDYGSSSGNLILIILLVVLFIGIVAAVVATVVSRRESQKAVEAAAASHPEPTVNEQADAAPAVPAEETIERDASDAEEALEEEATPEEPQEG